MHFLETKSMMIFKILFGVFCLLCEITIGLNEFTVADWWIEQYQHPREYSSPSFKNWNDLESFFFDL